MRRVAGALRREPVRAYLYGLLTPAAALAVTYGLVEQDKAVLWIALGGVVLVPGAAELARRKVTPTSDPRTKAGQPAELVPEPPPDGISLWNH
ncbi:MAG TPA: hypothetical protein VIQ30_09190 [Pseudonocardia sp.]